VTVEAATWSASLSSLELYVVAGLLRLTTLLGVEDPYPLLEAGPSEQDLEGARQSLAERGLLQRMAADSLTPGPQLATAVRAIAQARRTLVVTLTESHGAEHVRLFHLRPDYVVEQSTLPDGQVRLTTLKPFGLRARVEELVGPLEAPAADSGEIVLAESALLEARRLARDADACLAYLVMAGVPVSATVALTSELAEGTRAGSVVTLLRDEREIRYGPCLAWLVGRGASWRVVQIDKPGPPSIRLLPTGGDALARSLALIVAEPTQG
jgi:hypothetical protein